MARIRTIKPEFWTHEKVMECSLSARLMFIGMWNFADDLGRMAFAPKTIKAQLFPSDDITSENVLGMLSELSRNGLILTYEVDGREFIQITGWHHQRIDKPQAGKCPAPINGYSKNVRGTLPDGREGKVKESKVDNISEACASGAVAPNDDFEEFWKAKPRRNGADPKEPARKAFLAAVKAGTPAKQIIAAAKRWASVDADKIGTPYLPQSRKWLVDKRWVDYPPEESVILDFKQKYYAKADSPQLDAWDAYRRQTLGKNCPRDRNGGWYVDSEWPPGYVETEYIPIEIPKPRSM